MIDAVRTLPDGTRAVSKAHGSGWFGLEGFDPDNLADVIPVGFDIMIAIGPDGDVVGVGKIGGKVVDSDLFYALRQVVPTMLTAEVADDG